LCIWSCDQFNYIRFVSKSGMMNSAVTIFILNLK
jgi:hypothetical protein